jgi:tyrosinase
MAAQMASLFSSTNDPLFWVHHGGIDQFWARWQGRNWTRLQDVKRSAIELHRPGKALPEGKTKDELTALDSPIFHVGKFAPVIANRQVMDILNEDGKGFLCYKYDA